MRVSLKGLALVATGSCLSVAGFFLFRENPRISTLAILPRRWGLWLDTAVDLRTFLLAFLVSLAPITFFFCENRLRRGLLALVLLFLVFGEVCQIWIPSRTFSLLDLFYSFLGVLAAEGIALLFHGVARRFRGGLGRGEQKPGSKASGPDNSIPE